MSFVPGAAVAVQNIAFANVSVTFTSMNGGTNYPAGCYIVIAVPGTNMSASADTATIDPTGANLVMTLLAIDTAGPRMLIYGVSCPAGAIDTLVMSQVGNAYQYIGAAGCYLTGYNPTTLQTSVLATLSNEPVGPPPFNVPAGGIGIVAAFAFNNGTPVNPVTWANCVTSAGDVNASNATNINNIQISLAHTVTSGTWAPTITSGSGEFNFGAYLAAVSFGPSGGGYIPNNAWQQLGPALAQKHRMVGWSPNFDPRRRTRKPLRSTLLVPRRQFILPTRKLISNG